MALKKKNGTGSSGRTKKAGVKKDSTTSASGASKKDFSLSYNRFKFYQGKQYTGMQVGRGHKWYYDAGVWIDKKLTPDKWQIKYEVHKRRAGKAPEGSGAPVGTEYHWYILAHQMVKKLDANTYSTAMNGFKFKLAHKRKEKSEWNINDKSLRKQLIKILKRFIDELEHGEFQEVEMPAAAKNVPAKKKSSVAKASKTTSKKKNTPEAETA